MDIFPFTDAEWEPVEELALGIVDAGSADDDVLRDSLRLEIVGVLNDLRERHGALPFLLELVADYTEEDADRVALYRRALDTAVDHGLPTLSIRLSFARLLLELGDSSTASDVLRAGSDSVGERSEFERDEWTSLIEQAEGKVP